MKTVKLTHTKGYKNNWYKIWIDDRIEKVVLYYTNDSDEVKEKAKNDALEAVKEVKWTLLNPEITQVLIEETI